MLIKFLVAQYATFQVHQSLIQKKQTKIIENMAITPLLTSYMKPKPNQQKQWISTPVPRSLSSSIADKSIA